MRWNPATIYIPKYRANVAASKNRDGWLVLAEECQEFNDFFQLAVSSQLETILLPAPLVSHNHQTLQTTMNFISCILQFNIVF